MQLHQPRLLQAVFEMEGCRFENLGTKLLPSLRFGENGVAERPRAKPPSSASRTSKISSMPIGYLKAAWMAAFNSHAGTERIIQGNEVFRRLRLGWAVRWIYTLATLPSFLISTKHWKAQGPNEYFRAAVRSRRRRNRRSADEDKSLTIDYSATMTAASQTQHQTIITPWHVAFQIVEPFVVKITTPEASGTGFLVSSGGDHELLGIATAAHVINFPHYWEQPIRIQHFQSGKTVFLTHVDRYVDIDHDRDIALVVIKHGELPFPNQTLPIIAEDMCLKVGVQIGWMGFPAIAPNNLCFFSGSTSCWVGSEGFYFVDGVAINGVSGGPAFSIDSDNSVEIIGVVSAYVPNRATGAQLPGLCVVRDVLPLYETIKRLVSLEEAKKQEKPADGPPPPQRQPSSSDQTRY